MRKSSKRTRKRLRKQPRLRRLESANSAALPRLVIPKTAKRRQRRNKRRVRIPASLLMKAVGSSRWISLGLLALCSWALVLVGRDESFFLTSIPVEGAQSIPVSEIVAASGLAGRHVFSADPNEAAARIGEIPGVVSATVMLEWPNQVRVRIGEDSPVAVWIQAGETFWVNEMGDLVPARGEAVGLLRIRSQLKEQVGDLDFVPHEVLQGALQLRELRPNIDRLTFRPGQGLGYEDGRGWKVYFGQGQDMHQKLAIYETVVEELQARGVFPAYISVSDRDKPYYMARDT